MSADKPLPTSTSAPEPDADLIARARTALDDSAEQLDYASQLKLQRARSAALAALHPATPNLASQNLAPPQRWWRQNLFWLAAAPAALAIVVALPLLVGSPEPTDAMLASSEALDSFDDLALLATDTELELLSDMEFYQWLADNPDAGEA